MMEELLWLFVAVYKQNRLEVAFPDECSGVSKVVAAVAEISSDGMVAAAAYATNRSSCTAGLDTVLTAPTPLLSVCAQVFSSHLLTFLCCFSEIEVEYALRESSECILTRADGRGSASRSGTCIDRRAALELTRR